MDLRKAVFVAAAAALAFAFVGGDAQAKGRKKRRRPAEVRSVGTPVGDGGGNVVVPFVAASITGDATEIEVQYAIDANADGLLSDDEYRPATEDRLDPRNSRANREPQLYRALNTGGSQHAFVWRSLADVGPSRFPILEYALSPQGRFVPDPDNPGAFLFAAGPNGSPFATGIRVRIRAVVPHKKPKRRLYGPWVTTDGFSLENSNAPRLTIDGVTPGTAALVGWTAYDDDSEDLNGNGRLDVADGEDMNGNGVLDAQRVGVAFDFHRLAEGEDPSSMTLFELEELAWSPCTRDPSQGDTDSLDARPGVPVPTTGPLSGVPSSPSGRIWIFAWDAHRDAGPGSYVLRARPFDETRAVGQWVYRRTPVVVF